VITRIESVSCPGVLEGFAWPTDLPAFRRYNLIYGWNATGKTSISRLFRCVEKRIAPPEGGFCFSSGKYTIRTDRMDVADAWPPVRVFNHDYVTDALLSRVEGVDPIFYIGVESSDARKERDSLDERLLELRKRLADAEAANDACAKKLDEFRVRQGTVVRESLRSQEPHRYNNYDKRDYERRAAELEAEDPTSLVLASDQLDRLRSQVAAKPRHDIQRMALSVPLLQALEHGARDLLVQTPTGQFIETIRRDSELQDWMRVGNSLHRKRGSGQCLFCGSSPLPHGLLDRLDAHFSSDYERLVSAIGRYIDEVKTHIRVATSFVPAETAALYDDLQDVYVKSRKAIEVDIATYTSSLEETLAALEAKRTNPFLVPALEYMDNRVDLTAKLRDLNAVVGQHNDRTRSLEKVVQGAREQIEKHYIASSLREYRVLLAECVAAGAEPQRTQHSILPE
jgi:wobble nucleotide-excising tRNase